MEMRSPPETKNKKKNFAVGTFLFSPSLPRCEMSKRTLDELEEYVEQLEKRLDNLVSKYEDEIGHLYARLKENHSELAGDDSEIWQKVRELKKKTDDLDGELYHQTCRIDELEEKVDEDSADDYYARQADEHFDKSPKK